MKTRMQTLRVAWRRWCVHVDARPWAERVLALVLGLVLIGLALEWAWLGAVRSTTQAERLRIQTAQDQLQAMKQQTQAQQLLLQHDPDQALKARQAGLQAAWQASNARWAETQLPLSSPEQALALLAALLQKVPTLDKLELQVLPVQPADLGATPAAEMPVPPATPAAQVSPAAVRPAPLLWRQGLRLQVRGSYRDVVQYLQLLEQLPLRLHCQSVQLTSPAPTAGLRRVTATLEISTLSFDDRWLAF
jgi:MSHA biogenesis protein MshJ